MSFIVAGTNHKYSPLALREKLAFSKKVLRETMLFLKKREAVRGAVILSTCNRVEIYADAESSEGIREIKDFVSLPADRGKETLPPYLYIYRGRGALRHLFSVACGIDSLIVGETQIAGQVRGAFLTAKSLGCADGVLANFFYSALSFAAKVHREIRISEGKTSVASVALDFIREKKGVLPGKKILLIGTGKISRLVLQYLKKEEAEVVFIANRTFEKAKELADEIGGRAVRFNRLKEYLKKAEIVITATASPHLIIKKETLAGVACGRLLIVDLALPRDVDPKVKELKGVSLFTLEDLSSVISVNLKKKDEEAERAKELAREAVERLWGEFIGLEQEAALLP